MNNFRKIFILVAAFSIAACSSSPDEEEVIKISNQSPQALYQDAKETLENGLYNKAIRLYKALDSRYPFGPFSKQVQLDLMYAYHKIGDSAQATATIDRFIRLNPNHPDLDYVNYMRGVINMEANSNAFQEFFGIDRSDRDVTAARDAFNDFKLLIKNFPDSKYNADAQKRMVFLLNKLARRELQVADYYVRRGAYLAAANRGKYVVESYPNSPHVKDALEIMVECYDKLGLDEFKADALATLNKNF